MIPKKRKKTHPKPEIMVHQKYSEATSFSKILKSCFSVKVMKSTEFVAKFKTFICF